MFFLHFVTDLLGQLKTIILEPMNWLPYLITQSINHRYDGLHKRDISIFLFLYEFGPLKISPYLFPNNL